MLRQYLKAWRGRASLLALSAAVFALSLVGTASAACGEGEEPACAAVDVDKLTEPIQTEVTANTPKLLLFIGTILAIGFVIGWGISLLRKGKRT